MQWPRLLLAFLLSGCLPQIANDPLLSSSATGFEQKYAMLDENGVISVEGNEPKDGFLLTIKNFIVDGYAKMLELLGMENELSSYCETILQESPMAADFIKNWSPDDKPTYCPGNDTSSCKKKHNNAFQKGLSCYQGL